VSAGWLASPIFPEGVATLSWLELSGVVLYLISYLVYVIVDAFDSPVLPPLRRNLPRGEALDGYLEWLDGYLEWPELA
jgi:hypothetical protein